MASPASTTTERAEQGLAVLVAAAREALGDAVRVAQAAIRLAPMFLLRDEIPHASAAFALKFADMDRARAALAEGRRLRGSAPEPRDRHEA